MNDKDRQIEIMVKAAERAYRLPALNSGLWFHHDIRDNYYYATYLFAAAAEYPDRVAFDAETAKEKAVSVLLEVLKLQDQNPESVTYGHWPLHLEPIPREAKHHVLPVELMGSLMAYFLATYKACMDETLFSAFQSALDHVYRSGFYLRPENHFGHHDAKYTAAKLIFGQWFKDAELLEEGKQSLLLTLAHVRKQGMSEYGSLPWFWHWVQAFACAWKLTTDATIKQSLSEMLDFLWEERAAYYLKGTWVGAHSRGLKHDIPKDGSVLHDYVQFGDFILPDEMPRTEYAGFLYYEAPESARQLALHRSEPSVVTRLVTKQDDAASKLHSYAYITEDFAAGGMWERFEEFDNEQHRWDFTLPLGKIEGVNQAYFYHPSDPGTIQDPRHQSGHTEVLYDKNTILALYPIPEGIENRIFGVLPKTDWLQEHGLLLGQTGNVFWSIHLMQPFRLETLSDRCFVTSEGSRNGIVMEAVTQETAKLRGLNSFEAFASAARQNRPSWTTAATLQVLYHTLDSSSLYLSVDGQGAVERFINERPVDFSGYTV
ncbi:hypothetical protein [Paenibacillus harenae]|uniref:hypothetical protein n=1 Tax=Paenibacillus harenae TaxID=306543 RepID=UPI00040C3246|nr:hypothetical protein [Paenibacillus harenae]